MSSRILKSKIGGISLGNGFSNGNGGLTAKFPLLDFHRPTFISDFAVEPPRVKIDPGVAEIVSRISKLLNKKALKYNSKDQKSWSLKEILSDKDQKEGRSKAKLISDGFSAVISEVSQKINRSSIDHSTKFLLSNEPLYVYALSYAIYYEKVNDAEGINDRVIQITQTQIKGFFNVLIAKEIIQQKHLKLSSEQQKKIFRDARNSSISYVKGMPYATISKILSKFIDHGSLYRLVDMFFESGEVDPERGTPQIRQLMVKSLEDMGVIVRDEDEADIEAGFDPIEALKDLREEEGLYGAEEETGEATAISSKI